MARCDNLENFLQDVSDSIKAKKGIETKLKPENFDTEINSISTGIEPTGSLEVTDNGTFDVSDKASVLVNVEKGVFPSGNLEITESGTFDVTDKESVTVNIETEGVSSFDGEYVTVQAVGILNKGDRFVGVPSTDGFTPTMLTRPLGISGINISSDLTVGFTYPTKLSSTTSYFTVLISKDGTNHEVTIPIDSSLLSGISSYNLNSYRPFMNEDGTLIMIKGFTDSNCTPFDTPTIVLEIDKENLSGTAHYIKNTINLTTEQIETIVANAGASYPMVSFDGYSVSYSCLTKEYLMCEVTVSYTRYNDANHETTASGKSASADYCLFYYDKSSHSFKDVKLSFQEKGNGSLNLPDSCRAWRDSSTLIMRFQPGNNNYGGSGLHVFKLNKGNLLSYHATAFPDVRNGCNISKNGKYMSGGYKQSSTVTRWCLFKINDDFSVTELSYHANTSFKVDSTGRYKLDNTTLTDISTGTTMTVVACQSPYFDVVDDGFYINGGNIYYLLENANGDYFGYPVTSPEIDKLQSKVYGIVPETIMSGEVGKGYLLFSNEVESV